MAVLPATDRQQGRGKKTKQRKKEEVCASVRVGAELVGANMADITAGRKAAQANARITVFHRRGVPRARWLCVNDPGYTPLKRTLCRGTPTSSSCH